MTDEIGQFEPQVLADCRDDIRRRLFDDDHPPCKPTAARVDGVTDDRGELFDLQRSTPPADIVDVDPFEGAFADLGEPGDGDSLDPGFDDALDLELGTQSDLGLDGGFDL